MFCKNCGNKIADTAKFCPKCGTKQDVKRAIKEEVKQEPKLEAKKDVKQQPPVEKTEKEAKAEARVEVVAETVSKSIDSAKEKISDAVKSVNNEETRAAVNETAETVSKSIDSDREKISDAVKSINDEETKSVVKETIDATEEKVDGIGEFAEAAGQKAAGDLGAKITEKNGIKKPFKFLLPVAAVLMCIGVYFGFFHNSDPFVGVWVKENYLVDDKYNLRMCEITKNGDAYIINLYEGKYAGSLSVANKEEVSNYEKKIPVLEQGASMSQIKEYDLKLAKFNLEKPRSVNDFKYKWKKHGVRTGLIGIRNENILKTKDISMIYNENTKMLQLNGFWNNGQWIKSSGAEIKKFKEIRQNNIKMYLTNDYKERDEYYVKWRDNLVKFVQTGVHPGHIGIMDAAKLGKIEFVDDVPAK